MNIIYLVTGSKSVEIAELYDLHKDGTSGQAVINYLTGEGWGEIRRLEPSDIVLVGDRYYNGTYIAENTGRVRLAIMNALNEQAIDALP